MATRMLNPGLIITRYCALCDFWYPKGHFKEHKAGPLHQQCLADSKKMQAWYKTNGYGS